MRSEACSLCAPRHVTAPPVGARATAAECTFLLLDPEVDGGALCGDVNFFLNDHDEPTTAEIEVMVAEPRSRRKGIAAEALRIFMAYAAQQLVSVEGLVVRTRRAALELWLWLARTHARTRSLAH